MTLSRGALFASWKLLQFPSSLIVKVFLAIFTRASSWSISAKKTAQVSTSQKPGLKLKVFASWNCLLLADATAWGNSANSVCVVEGVDRSQLLHLQKSRYQRLRLHSSFAVCLHCSSSSRRSGAKRAANRACERFWANVETQSLSMLTRQKRPPNCMLAVKATAGTRWTLWISSVSLFWRDSNTQCSSCWQETASAAVRSCCHRGCSGPSQRRARYLQHKSYLLPTWTVWQPIVIRPGPSIPALPTSCPQARSWVKLQNQSLHCFHCSGKSSPWPLRQPAAHVRKPSDWLVAPAYNTVRHIEVF